MIYAFVALVFLGLVAGVRVMLYGVERQQPAGADAPRSFSAMPALLAAFCFVAGVVGYASMRLGLQPTSVWLAAIGVGAVAALALSRLIASWWMVVPEHDIDDERYVLQGSLGRVVADIGAGGAGKVSLESSGHKDVIPARAIDDQPMAAGTEVVIERIEDGVAYVEDWAVVEKRL